MAGTDVHNVPRSSDRPLGPFSSHILANHIPLGYKDRSSAILGRLFHDLSTESVYVIIY